MALDAQQQAAGSRWDVFSWVKSMAVKTGASIKAGFQSVQGWWIRHDYENFAEYLKENTLTHPCPKDTERMQDPNSRSSHYKDFTIYKPIVSSGFEAAHGAVSVATGWQDAYGYQAELEQYDYLRQHTYYVSPGGYYPKNYRVPYNPTIEWKASATANTSTMLLNGVAHLRPETFAKIYIRVDKCRKCWDASHTQYSVRSEHKESVKILRGWYKDIGMEPPF